MSWWEVHIILVRWSCVWYSTCQKKVECPHSNGGPLLLDCTTVVGYWAVGEPFLSGEDFEILTGSIINVIINVRSYVRFFIFSLESCLMASIFACMMSNCHMTCNQYCFFHLEIWSLRYEGKYHINRAMVMIWWYMVEMSINKQITWLNHCVRRVIWVE